MGFEIAPSFTDAFVAKSILQNSYSYFLKYMLKHTDTSFAIPLPEDASAEKMKDANPNTILKCGEFLISQKAHLSCPCQATNLIPRRNAVIPIYCHLQGIAFICTL